MLSTAMIVLEALTGTLYPVTVATIASVAAFARGKERREAAREVLVILLLRKSAAGKRPGPPHERSPES
ncbi:hypothetical protein SAMN05421837_102406 [Amycolatopsis pretoriensis]|uniref:Uncharacterized protein n=1 Tax=Amycolatopsis pretoriensis TaxID=218821 RepID=A0A1H5QCP8_9PSEU|nr:hypothetical protein [Amycolatopsis pretoriensis]SEF23779.1 hypothetical protein SAMN05421837_102406 [Amycolatopsis pretoriensis]